MACILYLGLFVAAQAHSTLIASEPTDAAVLSEAPGGVTLRFSEPVTPLVARLIHPDGRTEILKDDGGVGPEVRYALPAGLEHGTHVLSWRVTSSDGHPVGGGQMFSIGAPSAVGGVASAQSSPGVRAGLWSARLVLMLGLIFGVGSMAFATFAGTQMRRPARRIVLVFLLAGLLAAPALIGFQGLDALGETISGLRRSVVWQAGLTATTYGRSTVFAAAALLLAFAAQRMGPVTARFLTALGVLACGLAFASAGHAATASPRILMTAAVFLHVICVIVWIGALIPLADALGRKDQAAGGALRRFSSVIPMILFGLVVTGILLASVQLGHVSALWNTRYGWVLLVKLALIALLLGLAAMNRFRLTGRALAGETAALRHLRRSVVAEMAIAVVIVAVLGLWRFTPPPRALLQAAPSVQTMTIAKDGLSARLTLRPAEIGPVGVSVDDLRRDGRSFVPVSVSLDLEKPAYGIGPFTREARKVGEGSYAADGFFLPIDGFWIVHATVVVDEFHSTVLTDIFDVRKPPSSGKSFSSSGINSQ